MITISVQRSGRGSSTDPARDRRRKRGAVVKLSLGALALVGIGAGATAAAWTDDAWFTASATTPTIQLQGGTGQSPTTWSNADTSGAAITIPASAFANLAPGVTATAHVGLKNISTVPLTVAVPTATWGGDFVSSGSCALGPVTTVTINGGTSAVTLAATAGTTTDVLVSVATPSAWNGATTCQGKIGALTLAFTGTTS
jgi:hypothetical protein